MPAQPGTLPKFPRTWCALENRYSGGGSWSGLWFLLFFGPAIILFDAVVLVGIIHTIEFGSLIKHYSQPLWVVQIFRSGLRGPDGWRAFADNQQCAIYHTRPQVSVDGRRHGR